MLNEELGLDLSYGGDKMKYRVLGRTGLKVSELGLGGHEYRRPLPTTLGRWGEIDMEKFMRTQPERNKIIKRAMDVGINYFDTTQMEEAKSLGLALKTLGGRENIHIAAMIIFPFRKMEGKHKAEWREIILQGVEGRLKLLQTRYIDIFNLHEPEDSYSREKFEVTLEALREMKDEEKIRWIGASSHDPRFLAEIIRKYDCFDSVMIPYNYHQQEAREILFPLCKALEIGVVVMKPLSWPYYGIPFIRFGPVEGEEKSPYTPTQLCLRWILKSPEVSTVVPSVNSLEELEENLAAVMKEGEIDEKILDLYFKAATGPGAKEKLEEMLKDPAVDIRYYAKRALTSFS